MTTSVSTFTGDFGELVLEREMIEVRTRLPQPDPRWRYTDHNGHEHYYSDQREPYPTLERVADGDPYWCGECGEEHQDTKLVCRLCGEEISPGTYVDESPRYIPGMMSATLNGEPVTKEKAEEVIARERARRAAEVATRTDVERLRQAVRDLNLTEDQQRILRWVERWDESTVSAIAGIIERARAT